MQRLAGRAWLEPGSPACSAEDVLPAAGPRHPIAPRPAPGPSLAEERLPPGADRVALKKEIGLLSACAIIIGESGGRGSSSCTSEEENEQSAGGTSYFRVRSALE
uniref:Uncharacterized protein n=1 Tax=Varanus komodoensis TaxID=61221 RepID=A0A8D2L518_VARKO